MTHYDPYSTVRRYHVRASSGTAVGELAAETRAELTEMLVVLDAAIRNMRDHDDPR